MKCWTSGLNASWETAFPAVYISRQLEEEEEEEEEERRPAQVGAGEEEASRGKRRRAVLTSKVAF